MAARHASQDRQKGYLWGSLLSHTKVSTVSHRDNIFLTQRLLHNVDAFVLARMDTSVAPI